MNFFKKVRNLVVAGAAALFGAAAFADPTPLEAAITSVSTAVDAGLAGGLTVATAVVIGLFAIWAIKLLMKGK